MTKTLQRELGYLVNSKTVGNLHLGVHEVVELYFLEIHWGEKNKNKKINKHTQKNYACPEFLSFWSPKIGWSRIPSWLTWNLRLIKETQQNFYTTFFFFFLHNLFNLHLLTVFFFLIFHSETWLYVHNTFMFYKVLLRNFWSHSLSEALSHPASAQVSSSLSWTCLLKITWTTAGGIWGPRLLFFFFLLLFHVCNVSFIFIWRRLDNFLRIVFVFLSLLDTIYLARFLTFQKSETLSKGNREYRILPSTICHQYNQESCLFWTFCTVFDRICKNCFLAFKK